MGRRVRRDLRCVGVQHRGVHPPEPAGLPRDQRLHRVCQEREPRRVLPQHRRPPGPPPAPPPRPAVHQRRPPARPGAPESGNHVACALKADHCPEPPAQRMADDSRPAGAAAVDGVQPCRRCGQHLVHGSHSPRARHAETDRLDLQQVALLVDHRHCFCLHSGHRSSQVLPPAEGLSPVCCFYLVYLTPAEPNGERVVTDSSGPAAAKHRDPLAAERTGPANPQARPRPDSNARGRRATLPVPRCRAIPWCHGTPPVQSHSYSGKPFPC
mmetsp:Transcript_18318/g.43820  ORF Transcript_18318/g.43820 Transcript_18318/m.43820 type:complete len:269 (-) Transcript_18318:271-1077(-)